MIVFDHTHPEWIRKTKAHGKINGAMTYAPEIALYQIPLWEQATSDFDGEVVIGTCNAIVAQEELPQKARVVVQYLHQYPIKIHQKFIQRIVKGITIDYDHLVFVVAYRNFHLWLQSQGYNSILVPMSIVPPKISRKSNAYTEGKVVYFTNFSGNRNVTERKQNLLRTLKREFSSKGWRLDMVTGLEQKIAFNKVSKYTYGIGVGRCALEMGAMGLKVMVAGQTFGGLMTTEQEYQIQLDTNFNGRACTFDSDISTCIDVFPRSISRYNNIYDLQPTIQTRIEAFLSTIR